MRTLLVLLVTVACAAASAPAMQDGEAILRHIRALASDEMEGRAPGTQGEERTAAYMLSLIHI